MTESVCMICDKLRASNMSGKRDIYMDYYSTLSMNLFVDPETTERQYFISHVRYIEDKISEYKVIIKYCPFCGKELV